MVCCIVLSVLIAAAAFALRLARLGAFEEPSPLAWRLHRHLVPSVEAQVPVQAFSMSARLASFGFAIDGLREMVHREHNARVHLVITASVFVVAYWLELSLADWRWIIACIFWVWFAEAANTALEHLCDVVSPQRNDTVRFAKDIAAGAVLLSSLAAVIVGSATLIPYAAAKLDPSVDALMICRAP